MAVALSTPLCRDLGIEFPIFSVGFGISAGPELVAAVSNAGGCGVLGASGLPAQEVRQRIGRVRELTDRPFGVNIIIAELEEPFASAGDRALVLDEIAAALEEHAPLLVLFWGDPAPFVEEAHRSAVKVVIQVGSVAEAEAADAAGVDAVIAQGVEAGGHVRGRTSIWDLLPAAAEAVDPVPVLASGGIGDGAGLARALQLGAQGVSLGTRFVASDEAWIHPVYKQRVVDSNTEDTFYGELFDVWWPGRRTECCGAPRRSTSGTPPGGRPDFDGDPEYAPMWAGESCGVVNDVKPAGVIVRDLVREAEVALAAGGS